MENQTSKTEEKTFTINEIGVILERMDDKIEILAENQVSMSERLNRVENKIDRLQDDMVEVKYELKQKVSIDQFEKLEKRVVKLEKLSYSRN